MRPSRVKRAHQRAVCSTHAKPKPADGLEKPAAAAVRARLARLPVLAGAVGRQDNARPGASVSEGLWAALRLLSGKNAGSVGIAIRRHCRNGRSPLARRMAPNARLVSGCPIKRRRSSVESREVVHTRDAGDGRLVFQSGVWSTPVVAVNDRLQGDGLARRPTP
jgi:hypothetical protein